MEFIEPQWSYSLYNGLSNIRFRCSISVKFIASPLTGIDVETFVMAKITIEIDARGMDCPLPLLKAKQGLNKLATGEYLKVLATDAGSQRDFQVFCQQSGHTLEQSTVDNGVFTYIICRH